MSIFSNKDNRKKIRVIPEQGENIRIDLAGSNFLDIVYAKNISESGLGIWVPHRFEGCDLNQEVNFSVRLPPPIIHTFSFYSEIIAHNNFGVVFRGLSKKDQNYIRQYIQSRLKENSWLKKIQHNLKLI